MKDVAKAAKEATAISAALGATMNDYAKAHGGVPLGAAFLAFVYEVCVAAKMAGVSREDLIDFVGNGFDQLRPGDDAGESSPPS